MERHCEKEGASRQTDSHSPGDSRRLRDRLERRSPPEKELLASRPMLEAAIRWASGMYTLEL